MQEHQPVDAFLDAVGAIRATRAGTPETSHYPAVTNLLDAIGKTLIGGYQVIKKWLSYRDHSILDRPLTEAEVEHIQTTARRLVALRLLGPALDASYRACAVAHVPLPGPEGPTSV